MITNDVATDTTRDYLRTLLQSNVLNVTFTKSDGTERIMRCTTNPELIPSDDLPQGKRGTPDHLVKAYDLEADGWRSFVAERVKTFTVEG